MAMAPPLPGANTNWFTFISRAKEPTAKLCANLRNLDVSGAANDVYSQCALIERQIIWLWRVWYFGLP